MLPLYKSHQKQQNAAVLVIRVWHENGTSNIFGIRDDHS